MHNIQEMYQLILELNKLKLVFRNTTTLQGRNESTAEHSWSASMIIIILMDQLKQEFGEFDEFKADKAVVKYYNISSIRELVKSVSDYTQGECQHYHNYPNEPHFTKPANFQDKRWADHELIKSLWAAVGKSLLHTPRGWFPRFKHWLLLTPFIIISPKWKYLQANTALFIGAAAYRLFSWNKPLILKKYKYFHTSLLANQNLFKFYIEKYYSTCGNQNGLQAGECLMAKSMTECNQWGFHSTETHKAISFRWTKPNAVLKFTFEPGNYFLNLGTGPFRVKPDYLQIYFNGKLIPSCKFNSQGELQIPIKKENCNSTKSQYLVVLCQPLATKKHRVGDIRQLGLALSHVCLEQNS